MLLGAVNQRFSAFVQHSEMSDERLERRPVPGRRDHGIGIEPAPVSEDGGALLEPLERSDDTDATGLDAFDKADVEDRNHAAAEEVRVRPHRRR